MPDPIAIAPFSQVLCVGDSITRRAGCSEGYVMRLADEYSGKYDVLNRGYGGYTSRQLVRKMKEDTYLKPQSDNAIQVKLIVLHIGTNDSVTHGAQYVPLPEYTSNLHTILSQFRSSHPSAHILILTPSTVCIPQWGDGNRSPESAKAYAKACVDVAKEEGLPYIDCATLIDEGLKSGRDTPEDVFTDGLHMTSRGYKYIADEMMTVIKKEFKGMDPEKMDMSFTHWENY